MRGPGTAKTKQVWCTHCGGPNEVAARAMSVFCAHCHKRLILENLVIKTFQALRDYATCGDVTVEKRGRVVASIRSKKLIVKGKVEGDVQARGQVEVASTGSIAGDVNAAALLIRQGACVCGFCEIRPLPQDDAFAPACKEGDTRTRKTAPRSSKKPSAKQTISDAGKTEEPSGRGRSVKAIVTTRRRTATKPTKSR